MQKTCCSIDQICCKNTWGSNSGYTALVSLGDITEIGLVIFCTALPKARQVELPSQSFPFAFSRQKLRPRKCPLTSSTGPNDDCGNLSEVKVCREEDCDVHHWQAGLWGPCRAADGDASCGRGYRNRDVICVSKCRRYKTFFCHSSDAEAK
jgi:hypothetical protein